MEQEKIVFDDEIVSISLEMIMHSGDARTDVHRAFEAMTEFDFALADIKIADAKKKFAQAHHLQTDIVQSESEGVKREVPLIFAHAQDTLMTVVSEYNVAKQIKAVFFAYEKRLVTLEKQMKELTSGSGL
jgi:PTS system cellobiose-specific IIA component